LTLTMVVVISVLADPDAEPTEPAQAADAAMTAGSDQGSSGYAKKTHGIYRKEKYQPAGREVSPSGEGHA
jgi:hypothetical protein